MAWVVGAVALALPGEADAQVLRRFSLEVEGGAGTMLTPPQSDEYGLGVAASGRLHVALAGPFSVHIMGEYHRWSSQQAGLDDGALAVVGGGVRLAPRLSRTLGRVLLDLELGVSFTGGDNLTNPVFGVGVGWLIPLARVLDVGPVVRFGQVVYSGGGGVRPGSTDPESGASDARYWTAGLVVAFHAATEAPAPPPPRLPPPPADRDGDGLADPRDECPNEPEDRDGFQDEDGCPDVDNDGDTVLDVSDRCPGEPEDRDSHQDEDGCPDPDNDGDNLLDAADRCPNEPESVNQYQDEDGCPDEPPVATVEATRININQQVHFDFDTAQLQARSFAILDEVVRALVAHPELRRVWIEGHTDEQGGNDYNLRLSRERAEAVQRYLVEHGVAAGRLSTRGYGAERPAVPGATSEEARAQNRRVLFLLEDGGASATDRSSAREGRRRSGHRGRRRRR